MICPLCKNDTLVYDTYDGKFKCNHECNFITPSIFHDELQKLDELKVDAERTLNFVKPRIDYILDFTIKYMFKDGKPIWEESNSDS